MRQGVRIAVDPGTTRIGIARSDPDGILAVPVATVRRGKGDLDAIARLVEDVDAIVVFVGHPITLAGAEGPAAAAARALAEDLARVVEPVPVRLVDERLSTAQAQRRMAEAGRSQRRTRSVLDQQAAVSILQQVLDAERNTGRPAGTTVRTP